MFSSLSLPRLRRAVPRAPGPRADPRPGAPARDAPAPMPRMRWLS